MNDKSKQNLGETLKIEFPCIFDYVPIIRRLVSTIAIAHKFNKKDAYRIETLIDEICNNAIEYGSKVVNSLITLECEFTSQGLNFTVTDNGGDKKHCDRLKQSFKEAIQNKKHISYKRGRGLRMVQMLADELNIISDPLGGENEVHIVKWKRIQV